MEGYTSCRRNAIADARAQQCVVTTGAGAHKKVRYRSPGAFSTHHRTIVRQIKSSLEAEVDIILPDDLGFHVEFSRLLRRHESFLKTLFIVSDVRVTDTRSLGDMSPQWSHMDTLQGRGQYTSYSAL